MDNILALRAKGDISLDAANRSMGLIARIFKTTVSQLQSSYVESRKFSAQHKGLLRSREPGCDLEQVLTQIGGKGASEDIDNVDCTGRSALAWAVEYGWAEAVKILIRLGVDVNQVRRSGQRTMPLLHLAVAGPKNSESTRTTITQILLQAGANTNARDDEQWTSLHVAASWGLDGVVNELLQSGQGIDLRALNNCGESARDLALAGGFDVSVFG